eukprot:CAMPEP_0197678148 /NCGR_PEP_ID=MMETSP1338-20131121/89552_1 /TAXON_ID=43686 ORGANISM="Pelagodinium beii, Strain RCC1491" /NCGR_SAMPLE_ID=MMETSP1338 /ASSEMBLY_ACC=CAM_ASM_000754 /LENGTH=68 /DNA_ID=CAMNT_0043259047 /DNA_START=225 /DNA_END=428 /DNA_ORIENTATION=+
MLPMASSSASSCLLKPASCAIISALLPLSSLSQLFGDASGGTPSDFVGIRLLLQPPASSAAIAEAIPD